MHKNPERLAWTVLIVAFAVFCTLSISIPLGVRWYIINARVQQETTLTSVRGTVILNQSSNANPVPIVDGNTMTFEGKGLVSTDDTSQAILTMFDDSSITVYSDTQLDIREVSIPRFGWSSRPDNIMVELTKGRIRISPNENMIEGVYFRVETPHSSVELGEGSFSIEVDGNLTQVTVRRGEARVMATGGIVKAREGERVTVYRGKPPSEPMPAAQDLLVNGGFEEPLSGNWEIDTLDPSDAITVTIQQLSLNGRGVVQFSSQGQDNLHSEVGITQQVDKDVRDYASLKVQMEVRLVHQSLPGGGMLGSEFPVMVHVAFKDEMGNDNNWYHGFYFSPPPENYILYNNIFNSSESVARYVWYPYESVNLLNSLGSGNKPVYIKSIRVYASGWIYDSMVSNVSLLAQE